MKLGDCHQTVAVAIAVNHCRRKNRDTVFVLAFGEIAGKIRRLPMYLIFEGCRKNRKSIKKIVASVPASEIAGKAGDCHQSAIKNIPQDDAIEIAADKKNLPASLFVQY